MFLLSLKIAKQHFLLFVYKFLFMVVARGLNLLVEAFTLLRNKVSQFCTNGLKKMHKEAEEIRASLITGGAD